MVPQREVVLRMTPEQAAAVEFACDAVSRLGAGQLQILAEMIDSGFIPIYSDEKGEPRLADAAVRTLARDAIMDAKHALGFPRNGNRGVGHRHNQIGAHRMHEIATVVRKVLAEHKDPEPAFRSHHYDGLTVRYTQDPAPVAEMVEPDTVVPRPATSGHRMFEIFAGRRGPTPAGEA